MWDFPHGSGGKESGCSAGDPGDMDSILGQEDSPGERNDNPFQYSCLQNPMAWWTTVHRVTEGRKQPGD